ncbi:hypothetical protein ACPCHT_33130 [Nucisporomicrobium flavum]|uniref:hypothetical protein n=1 Tax=Nucisporomicrobium flavum TaxID=2785915 RepID=UPI001F22C069|nr:hypothetical protein [Nucisporomicrobium flavum]
MIKQAVRAAAVLAAGLAGTIALAAPGHAAVPGGATPGSAAVVSYEDAVPGLAPAGATGVYLDRQGRRIAQPASGPASSAQPQALLGCTPESGRDNPHYSSGDVSGHGWWKKGSCTADTAHVYNCLYEWYTDASWRQKACSPTKQLRPYTGSGDRTVARATCNSTGQTISWRNHVDVDVDGQIDSSEWPYNQANVNCVVN